MNPTVLVIDDEVFWRQLPASRSVEEMAVHLLGHQRGAPWLDTCAEKHMREIGALARGWVNGGKNPDPSGI